MKDARYSMARYLDPDNPKSGKKEFYSPNILKEFDKHYTPAKAAPAVAALPARPAEG